MSASNTVAELDFAKIKQSLIDTFKTNPTFTDYDFSGSTVSALLDMLAYVTHYQGVYANLAFAERFIDTAQLRNSIVSLAKELGYFPAQAAPAKATLTLSIDAANVPGNPSSIISNSKINFVGVDTNDNNHEFWSQADVVFNLNNGVYSADLTLTQGTPVEQRFVYTNVGHRAEFILPNSNINLDTIVVKVKDNSSVPDSQAVTWNRSQNIGNNTSSSLIWFIEETTDNKLRLSFGDDVIGKAPALNNEIIVTYEISEGSAANTSKGFSITSANVAGYSPNLFTISNEVQAQGGTDPEPIESIRLNAPGVYASQQRAVTITDYRALLLNKFQWIKSINVWGGENNSVPQYGQVYISIVPDFGTKMTLAERDNVSAFLNTVSIVGTGIHFVDPSILYVDTTTTAKYSRDLTSDSHVLVEAAIDAAIDSYFTTTSGLLNQSINFSKLLAAIDAAHIGVTSNITDLNFHMDIIPDTVHSADVVLDFTNAIVAGSVMTNTWTSPNGDSVYMKDDGNGNIHYVVNGVELKNSGNQYNVDYTNGIITLNGFLPNIAPASTITFNAKPQSNDLVGGRSTIIEIGNKNTTAVLA